MNNITVCAENSFELQASNQRLSEWCSQKIKTLEAEGQEVVDSVVCGENFGMNVKNLKATLNRIQRKIRYYQKLQKAIDLGYAIIPNAFWQETIAVRVKEGGIPKYCVANTDNLPAGEGHYVDDKCFVQTERFTDDKGNERKRDYPTGYDDEIDFPLVACKTKLIEATQHAMSFLVFDEVAISGRSADPLIIGKIKRPDGMFVDFIIAWWVDTNAL